MPIQNFLIFTQLKKFLAIFLLLQFLTNNSFAEELFKLPKLFIHFHHHAHEHHDTDGFFNFLNKHYSNNHEKEEHSGEDKDCDLPFKHCSDCCVGSHAPIIAFLPTFNEARYDLRPASLEKHILKNEKIKSICSPSIWQPPKFI